MNLELKWLDGLEEDSLVLAGVSGGPDSLLMATLLAEQTRQRNFRLELVHVNHGIRGEESDADEAFVREFADAQALTCHIQRIQPEMLKGKRSLADEGALRRVRLSLMRSLAGALSAGAISLGHHRDDLAETFLLMALRGSGPTGLGSLRASRQLDNSGLLLVRPLLNLTRHEIEVELRRRGQDWRIDATNESPRHQRNRIRNEVLPLLDEIAPPAAGQLADSAQICGDAADFLQEQARVEIDRIKYADSGRAALLGIPELRDKHPALLAEVIRQAWVGMLRRDPEKSIVALPPRRALTHEIVDRIQQLKGDKVMFGPQNDICFWCSNRFGLIYFDEDDLKDAFFSVADGFDFPVALDPDKVWGDLQKAGDEPISGFADGSQFRWGAPGEGFEDFLLPPSDEITGPLCLRTARRDDTFPLRAGGRKKVWSLLQEKGVPPILRPHVSVLADAERVWWIPGLRLLTPEDWGLDSRILVWDRESG